METNVTCEACIQDVTSFASNVIISGFIGIFLIVGTVGNAVTIIVIMQNRPLHSTSNMFIVSLCFSDLISAVFCSPLWLYRRTWGFEKWLWGVPLCRFYWMIDFATNYVTALHIFSFAILRFLAVKRPFSVQNISKLRVTIYICFLWIVSVGVALPTWTYMDVSFSRDDESSGFKWPSCSIKDDNNTDCCVKEYHIYLSIISPIFFYVPELLVLILSLMIARVILKQQKWRRQASAIPMRNVCSDMPPSGSVSPNNRPISVITVTSRTRTISDSQTNRERGTFTQLSLIVLTFMLGYIPVTVYLIWTTVTESQNYLIDYWFGVASYICLRLSECMNPIMYNLGSSNMRNATKNTLKKWLCCQK